jgi:hypothetical protein
MKLYKEILIVTGVSAGLFLAGYGLMEGLKKNYPVKPPVTVERKIHSDCKPGSQDEFQERINKDILDSYGPMYFSPVNPFKDRDEMGP